jgi:uncharacterized C2H2 Zn-finger protein
MTVTGEPEHEFRASSPALSITTSDYPEILRCSEPGCSASFTGRHRRGTLHRHVRLKHKGKQLPCGICGIVFQRQDARSKHCREEHSELLNIQRLSGGKRQLPGPDYEFNSALAHYKLNESSSGRHDVDSSTSSDGIQDPSTYYDGVQELLGLEGSQSPVVSAHSLHEKEDMILHVAAGAESDDDRSSVFSGAASVALIFSDASLASTATELSKASVYSASQIMTASRELVLIFP